MAEANQTSTGADKERNAFTRFLDFVEWLGNLLPHPVTLFAIFTVAVVFLSGVADWFGLSVEDPRPEGAAGREGDGVISVVSLLNGEGLRRIVMNLVSNFVSFVPLGTVLVAMLGVGIAERSGLISAAIRTVVLRASRNTLTVAVVFAAILSNTASEMGYVVLIPLAAVLFYSVGRHPLAGLAAAFAGVSGGYSANLLLGTVDPLLAGITETAAKIIDPSYELGPEINWYFMIISTFFITLVGSWVTIKVVEPKLGPYDPNDASIDLKTEATLDHLTEVEKRGLRAAGIACLIVAGLLALSIAPGWGVLRHPETGAIAGSPFLRGMVALILVFFAVPGIVYGRVVGTLRTDVDVIKAMSETMGTLGMYIVLVFFASQFVAFFSWTNFGAIFAVLGADLLDDIGLTGPLVFVPFILMCAFVNLMLGSASAQWAITAPIFVPMLMLTGYAPEIIQAAYRIGDSTTNIITPMMSYFGLILAFATRYKKDTGIGTMVAMMLPYSIFFLLGWIVLFYLWVFGFDLPVGPASATYYTPTT